MKQHETRVNRRRHIKKNSKERKAKKNERHFSHSIFKQVFHSLANAVDAGGNLLHFISSEYVLKKKNDHRTN